MSYEKQVPRHDKICVDPIRGHACETMRNKKAVEDWESHEIMKQV